MQICVLAVQIERNWLRIFWLSQFIKAGERQCDQSPAPLNEFEREQMLNVAVKKNQFRDRRSQDGIVTITQAVQDRKLTDGKLADGLLWAISRSLLNGWR
jgi:hypothetical protein